MMVNKRSAPHYLWGLNCDGWHLMDSPLLSVIQERMPPGTYEHRHYHTSARQFFFILRGAATLEVNGELEILEANDGIEIDPGIPHHIFNHTQAEVEFLVISNPPTRGDRINLE